jgi:predicted NAD/FAD-binding protein
VGAPRQVFDRMTEPFSDKVHTDHEITSVKKRASSYVIADKHGRSYEVDKVIFACDAASALNALESPTWLQRTLLGNTRYVDDIDPTFASFVIHSDTTVLPEKHRERILSEYNTYSEIDDAGALECTFVISAQNPSTKDAGVPMLVTFNSRKAIDKAQKRVELPHSVHAVSLRNLLIMSLSRHIQGKNGFYYCSTFTTPEGAHDLSFMSGLVAAQAIGAPYPFSTENTEAVADFRLMQKMMLKRADRSA